MLIHDAAISRGEQSTSVRLWALFEYNIIIIRYDTRGAYNKIYKKSNIILLLWVLKYILYLFKTIKKHLRYSRVKLHGS
jgi:hypothetical protein